MNVEEMAQALLPVLRELIEEEAQRLPLIVTAAELAEYLKTTRQVIYNNADQLGAIRLGDGKRPRLRFRLDCAQVRAWQAGASKPSLADARRPPKRVVKGRDDSELLPIRRPR